MPSLDTPHIRFLLSSPLTADPGESRRELEQALTIAEGEGFPEAERAPIYYSLGLTLYYLDEYDAALESYRAALGLYRAVGDRLGEANTIAALSRLALRQGRDDEARALLQQAVSLHQAIGDRYSVAADLGNFGLVLRDLGRIEEARPYLLQAAEIFDGIGLPQRRSRCGRVAQDYILRYPRRWPRWPRCCRPSSPGRGGDGGRRRPAPCGKRWPLWPKPRMGPPWQGRWSGSWPGSGTPRHGPRGWIPLTSRP